LSTRPYKQDVEQEYDLVELIERFGSEGKCHDYLEGVRWPDGVRCPRCDSDKISRIAKRRQFDCDSCRYQFSVRVNTLLHDSKLPLWKWFLAVYLMCESKKGISANQMKRTLGVSYKTAWYLCHRIRSAMEGDGEEMLRGVIEADETFVGGVKKARDRKEAARTRRSNKAVVVGAIERGGELRLRVAPNAGRGAIHAFLGDVVDPDADALYTDSWRAYNDSHLHHESVDHKAEEWVRGDVHTQTIESAWSLFKRSIVGSYHQLSVKHLPAYLDEMEWRYNNRANPYLFRDTILKLIEGDVLPYEELIAAK
jgi:transposase-like protein